MLYCILTESYLTVVLLTGCAPPLAFELLSDFLSSQMLLVLCIVLLSRAWKLPAVLRLSFSMRLEKDWAKNTAAEMIHIFERVAALHEILQICRSGLRPCRKLRGLIGWLDPGFNCPPMASNFQLKPRHCTWTFSKISKFAAEWPSHSELYLLKPFLDERRTLGTWNDVCSFSAVSHCLMTTWKSFSLRHSQNQTRNGWALAMPVWCCADWPSHCVLQREIRRNMIPPVFVPRFLSS